MDRPLFLGKMTPTEKSDKIKGKLERYLIFLTYKVQSILIFMQHISSHFYLVWSKGPPENVSLIFFYLTCS